MRLQDNYVSLVCFVRKNLRLLCRKRNFWESTICLIRVSEDEKEYLIQRKIVPLSSEIIKMKNTDGFIHQDNTSSGTNVVREWDILVKPSNYCYKYFELFFLSTTLVIFSKISKVSSTLDIPRENWCLMKFDR